jgi:hypothetical protein
MQFPQSSDPIDRHCEKTQSNHSHELHHKQGGAVSAFRNFATGARGSLNTTAINDMTVTIKTAVAGTMSLNSRLAGAPGPRIEKKPRKKTVSNEPLACFG